MSGPNTESSNVERIASLQGALKIFLDHPIFGGGLGLFVAERLRQFGKTLVIHSTPLWLLAETGIVGLFVVATLFARVLISEFRRIVRGDSISLLIVLILWSWASFPWPMSCFINEGSGFCLARPWQCCRSPRTERGTVEAQKSQAVRL